MIPLSILDLVPVTEGSDARTSYANMVDLARLGERLGYRRFWLAEHHNMPGIASAATSVLIGHVGSHTSKIRIGAGGIMLPNHAPLQVAEQFGTLASLYPGRVDLGLGRAPGTDQAATRALRRYYQGADEFPNDVVELLQYFEPVQPGQQVRAVPGPGLQVEAWILGSSLFGAQLAAALGLPYAFASHFAPDMLEQAIAIYRQKFRPSARLQQPHVMLALNVVAAETDAEAKRLFTTQQLGLHQPAAWPPRARAAPGGRHHGREHARGARRRRPGAGMRGDRLAGHRGAGNRGVHRAPPAGRADADRQRVRPRGTTAIV